MFMDGAPICSLSLNNLGNNGLMALCAARSSLSNLKKMWSMIVNKQMRVTDTTKHR